MLNSIPRPFLVVVVLLAGIAFFFFASPPHSVCHSQLEVFNESQKGGIFPVQGKNIQRPALFERHLESCKIGNSPGACYELFLLLRRLQHDIMVGPQECQIEFGAIPEVRQALREGIRLMAQIAWGEKPPEPGIERVGWLESSDLALFCQLKVMFLRIYGNDEWDAFKESTYKRLPGEAQAFSDGVCVNCESIKTAPDVFPIEEIWVRSLFSIRCEQYR